MQADPRSPERGQYGFLQDLVRHVAYETLAKRERRAKHLAAAEYLSEAFAADEDEVVEVIASHYLAAHEAAPDADDADEIKEKARADARARRASVPRRSAAAAEARRYFEQAAELTDRIRRSEPSSSAAPARWRGRAGEPDAARRCLEESIELLRASRATRMRPRAGSRCLGEVDAFTGRRDEALAADGAGVRRHLGRRARRGSGDARGASCRVGTGSAAISSVRPSGPSSPWTSPRPTRIPTVLALALRAKAAVVFSRGHREESNALLRHALQIALDDDLADDAGTCYFLLSDRMLPA